MTITPKERAAYQRREHEHRHEWLTVYRLMEGCTECGYAKSARPLHFHHRDPATKKFCIYAGNVVTRSWDVVLAEIAKCDVLCANCHEELHESR